MQLELDLLPKFIVPIPFPSPFSSPKPHRSYKKRVCTPFLFGAHIFTLGNENGNGIEAPMNQNKIGAPRWKWRWKCNWTWTLGSLEPLPIPFSFLQRKWKWNWTSNEMEASLHANRVKIHCLKVEG